ncbi:hypothetical protein [Xanthobacter sediminis]
MGDDWGNFLTAQVGASAALLGLLFVGVSLNLSAILAARHLPRRAMLAMTLLLVVMLISMVALVPHLPVALLGAFIFVLGAALFLAGHQIERVLYRSRAASPAKFVANLVLFECAVVPYLVAGALMAGGFGGGPYWLAAGMILSTVKAVSDAWVLLVEINR